MKNKTHYKRCFIYAPTVCITIHVAKRNRLQFSCQSLDFKRTCDVKYYISLLHNTLYYTTIFIAYALWKLLFKVMRKVKTCIICSNYDDIIFIIITSNAPI